MNRRINRMPFTAPDWITYGIVVGSWGWILVLALLGFGGAL